MEDKLIFKRKVRANGGSLEVVIPPEIATYLNIKGGDEIDWVADKSKHGLFAGVWNPEQQKKK